MADMTTAWLIAAMTHMTAKGAWIDGLGPVHWKDLLLSQ